MKTNLHKIIKSAMSFVLVLVVTGSLFASYAFAQTEQNPFRDVKETDWFYDDVMYAYEKKIIKGTGADTFEPHAKTTRAAFVTMLYRAEGEPDVTEAPDDWRDWFIDVGTGSWYYDAVVWAKQKDVLKGMTGSTAGSKFEPDISMNRAMVVTMLDRLAAADNIELTYIREYKTFSDAEDIPTWAKDSFEKLYRAGVINGKSDDILDPRGDAARSEMCAMINRFMKLKGE